MEHQVLARKWRPRTFEQMVGQEHVLKALVNALDQDRLHHAYLFTGTRGVGKTTIARILAKCLNCESGVSSTPCNECPSCIEINEGRCVDLIEVDAASRTKVEDTRELLDNVQYAPTRCRFKIYLIDEVHMLSSHSFNALLKTLEEPPPHIKFLLATTDPQKLPVTILSRCLQFNLKNLPPDSIVGHLQQVLTEEHIEFDDAALWHLGRAADGSMRDALSLTDQAIAYGENSVHEADVGAMLGTIDRGRVYHLLEALFAGDAQQLLEQVTELANYAPDYLSVLDELIGILHRVAVAQAVPGFADNSLGDLEKIESFATQITAEDLQLYYQIALIGRRDLPLNPDLRAGLEMVLLRMVAFRPDSGAPLTEKSAPPAKKKVTPKPATESPAITSGISADSLASDKIREKPRETVRKELSVTAETSASSLGLQVARDTESAQVPRPKLDLVVNNGNTATDQIPKPELKPDNKPAKDQPPEVVEQKEPATPEHQEALQPEVPRLDLERLDSNEAWITLVSQLPIKGMSKNILMQCVFSARREQQLQLQIDPQYIDLLNDAHQQRITDALTAYFGTPIGVKVDAGRSEDETPIAYQQRKKAERLEAARNALEQDPVVQEIIKRFDAVLDSDSIEPRDESES